MLQQNIVKQRLKNDFCPQKTITFECKNKPRLFSIVKTVGIAAALTILSGNFCYKSYQNKKAEKLCQSLTERMDYGLKPKDFELFMDSYEFMKYSSNKNLGLTKANTYLETVIDSLEGKKTSPGKIFNLDKAYEIMNSEYSKYFKLSKKIK